jgi:hypothetical protein
MGVPMMPTGEADTLTPMSGHGSAAWGRYRRVGQRRVQGWVDPESFDVVRALSDQQDVDGVRGAVAEIGVHHGRLFIGLQLLVPPGTPAVAIDLFENQADNTDLSGKGDRARFEANVRAWGDWDAVRVHSVNSRSVTPAELQDWAAGRIRLFSVDGGHTADLVASDLRLAEATLADGGVVVVDDVFNPEWPGVATGTYAHLAAGSALVPITVAYDKVYFTNSEAAADRYRAAMERAFEPLLRAKVKESAFAGFPVTVVVPERLTARVIMRQFALARRLHAAFKRG